MRCPTCSTPLDEVGACVTCLAQAEGLSLLARSDYSSVREIMGLLEEAEKLDLRAPVHDYFDPLFATGWPIKHLDETMNIQSPTAEQAH